MTSIVPFLAAALDWIWDPMKTGFNWIWNAMKTALDWIIDAIKSVIPHKDSSKRKLPFAYVSYHSIPRNLAYCKKVESMLHDAINHVSEKQPAIVVVCLQKTRPIEDLDGALEDFTDDELRRIYFVYIITDDRYFLTKEDIPVSGKYRRYADIVEIYNYSTENKGKEVINELRKDLASRTVAVEIL